MSCVLHQGSTKAGYGIYYIGKHGYEFAHVRAWEEVNGPLPDGMEIHHSCEVTLCKNPDHLVAMTHPDHMREHTRLKIERGCPDCGGEMKLVKNGKGDSALRCVPCRRAAKRLESRRYRSTRKAA